MRIAITVIFVLFVAVVFLLILFIAYAKDQKAEQLQKENELLEAEIEKKEKIHKTYVEELKKNEKEYHDAISNPGSNNGTAAAELLHQLSEKSRR